MLIQYVSQVLARRYVDYSSVYLFFFGRESMIVAQIRYQVRILTMYRMDSFLHKGMRQSRSYILAHGQM